MATEKPTKARPTAVPRERVPRPNNPYGLVNEEWTRLNLESSRDYAGKCIAWSRGHDKVLASGDSFLEVERELARLGLDVRDSIYEYVEPSQVRLKTTNPG